ncbi:MAG: nucleoside triphosphate pyrophosphohydrolase [Chitinophagaceae bacterium]|nr:nucleoside triphosphate pyrophosphohydrolase [Chitinophagaceae bacterium]
MKPYAQSVERLVRIMDELRTQCPWDKKQTIQTLRQLTIEETYELADSITDANWQGLKEELGDILLHIVFYARIAKEENQFNLGEVIEGVCNKLVHRHPHIYSSVQVENEDDVKRNWEQLKLKEGKKSILAGVPNSLPAMVKALRIQEKAKQVGFEWEMKEQVMDKIREEVGELEQAVQAGNTDSIEDEFGDVLFSMVNYARFLNIDPENALARTNNKFKRRFDAMEQELTASGASLNDFSLNEMDAVWNRIKQAEKGANQ